MTASLTPWFDRSVKPARKGVYQIKKSGGLRIVYSNWNGEWWGYRMSSQKDAASYSHCRAAGPVISWRGLSEKPK